MMTRKLFQTLLLGCLALSLPTTLSAQMPSFTTEPAHPNTIAPYKIIAEIQPGDTYEDAVILSNNMDYDMELTNGAADLFMNEKGEKKFSNGQSPDDHFWQWVTIEEKTVLKPGEQKTVPFSITIPEDTPLDTYQGGITSKLRGKQKDNLITSYRIVTPLEVNITDDPQPVPKLKDAQTSVFEPTPYFWASTVIFLASMAYYVYANKKEKQKGNNSL